MADWLDDFDTTVPLTPSKNQKSPSHAPRAAPQKQASWGYEGISATYSLPGSHPVQPPPAHSSSSFSDDIARLNRRSTRSSHSYSSLPAQHSAPSSHSFAQRGHAVPYAYSHVPEPHERESQLFSFDTQTIDELSGYLAPLSLSGAPPAPAPIHLKNDAAQMTPPRKCQYCRLQHCTNTIGQETVDVPRRLLEPPMPLNLPMIARDTSTIIDRPTLMVADAMAPVVVKGHMDNVLDAIGRIQSILSSLPPEAFGQLPVATPVREGPGLVHIFVDFSNISVGAIKAGIRLDTKRLLSTLQMGREDFIATRELIGSNMSADDIAAARSMRFTTRTYSRVYGSSEQLVDDKLHGQILSVLVDTVRFPSPQTLLLVTGDGNTNSGKGNTSFPKCVQLALHHGWSVEVWAWRGSINSIFSEIASKHPVRMSVHHLEEYRAEIEAGRVADRL